MVAGGPARLVPDESLNPLLAVGVDAQCAVVADEEAASVVVGEIVEVIEDRTVARRGLGALRRIREGEALGELIERKAKTKTTLQGYLWRVHVDERYTRHVSTGGSRLEANPAKIVAMIVNVNVL